MTQSLSQPHVDNAGTVSPTPALIDHVHDAERDYIIRPRNLQFFVRTGKQVIAACNTQMKVERWVQVYEAMLGHVSDFAQQNDARVRACYAVPRSAKTLLKFVPVSDSFDFDLAPLLAELQYQINADFPILGMIEVGQVPHWDLERFVPLNEAEEVFRAGARDDAASAVDAPVSAG